MSKLFGYSNTSGRGWFVSGAYNQREIEQIKDPEGGTETNLPTAIPSPFARIDLVRVAFRNIEKTVDLKEGLVNGILLASREDEKMVSDCLDVLELLFNIDSLRGEVKIHIWDKETALAKLKNSNSDSQKRFADTLELYLRQDSTTYNFKQFGRCYLIEYKHQIIAGTSPVTIFFTTANDMSELSVRLTDNDILFDKEYTPLYKRDPEFQVYLHSLFESNESLGRSMPVFKSYLVKSLSILRVSNSTLYERISNIGANEYFERYSELDTGVGGSIVEVLGVSLRKRKKEDIVSAIKGSDFVINTKKSVGDVKPLVLQNGLNKPLKYANDFWKSTFVVPTYDEETVLEKRWLPELKCQYPYLTVSDFLEPYLTRLVFPLNKSKFFDGNFQVEVGDGNKQYLLPIKPAYFKYFGIDDLMGSMPDGKKSIELVQISQGAVKVILRIPIARSREYICFERLYYPTAEYEINVPDEYRNKGVIVEQQLGVTLFPFVKVEEPSISPFYRIQLIDRDASGIMKHAEYDLDFYDASTGMPVPLKSKKKRSSKSSSDASTSYYVLEHNFDFIQVRNLAGQSSNGIIVPKWPSCKGGNRVFSFAIDFGTTNTHIEYKVDGVVKPFDIGESDMQIATLFDPIETTSDFSGSGAIAIRELIDYEFVPALLTVPGSSFRFPTRTVSAENPALNIQEVTFTLADFNIPFVYEREHDPVNEVKSNLKWARKDPGNEQRIRSFFEQLMMLMRNKVLFHNGNLRETELIWFYPSSMTTGRRNDMQGMIDELYSLYFSTERSPIPIVESLAPFYYYKGAGKLPGGAFTPVVSIDIGGGTTDVVVFKSNKPMLLTSFRFAANSIFGDGFYEFGASNHGIVHKYAPIFETLLGTNKLYNLSKLFHSIRERGRSEDINAFLFSLENHKAIQDKSLFSYNNKLAKDEELKIVFLYFYSAIVYHIAELMRAKRIELPSNLVFSGTGSKILSIISPNTKTLSNLTKVIFETVYGEPCNESGISLRIEKDSPKEVTCKGGLMTKAEDLDIDVKNIKSELTCIPGLETTKLSREDIDEVKKAQIIEYVNAFHSFFLKLDEKIHFSDVFNVSESSMGVFRSEMNRHLRDYLEEGLEFSAKLDGVQNGQKELEETLFFYPITGLIKRLTERLTESEPV